MNQNFYSSRLEILKIRANYLEKNASCFNGNTKERVSYIKELTRLSPKLCSYQRDLLIGLNLSDSSLQRNSRNTSTRMKIQLKSEKHCFLEFIKQCTLEYCGNDNPLSSSNNNRNMTSFNTLSTPQINEIADLFKSEDPSALQQRPNAKAINPRLVNELTPVSIAFWYCGDGGIRNGSKNEGKAMTLSTNGFTKNDHYFLLAGLKNCGITGKMVLDNPEKNQYRIDIPGHSYDDFVQIVGPHIHHEFFYKIPDGRKEGSHYGHMTSNKRSLLLGCEVPSMFFS